MFLLCVLAATCSASVLISVRGSASTPPPAWFTAARAEDAATRALERAEDAAILGSLQKAVGNIQQTIGNIQQTVGSLQHDFGSLRQNVRHLQQTARSQGYILEQVARAVVTQAVAGQVEQCAPSTALYLEIGVGGGNFSLCSAVPMFSVDPRPAPAATPSPIGPSFFFLTSAHCFNSHIPREPVHLAFQASLYRCSEQRFFNVSSEFVRFPVDLALVRCAGVPAPPTTISAQPYLLHQPAALLGFSPGKHVSGREGVLRGEKLSVLHIRFTRLALTLQLPTALDTAKHASSDERGAGSRTTLLPHKAAGFVDISPERGMSGGAVVDLQCGLWGMTESKSLGGVGGSFVLLNPNVVAMVKAAAAVL